MSRSIHCAMFRISSKMLNTLALLVTVVREHGTTYIFTPMGLQIMLQGKIQIVETIAQSMGIETSRSEMTNACTHYRLMASGGFGPPTPSLRVKRSNQTEP